MINIAYLCAYLRLIGNAVNDYTEEIITNAIMKYETHTLNNYAFYISDICDIPVEIATVFCDNSYLTEYYQKIKMQICELWFLDPEYKYSIDRTMQAISA